MPDTKNLYVNDTGFVERLMKEVTLKPKGSLLMGEVAKLVAVQRLGGRLLP